MIFTFYEAVVTLVGIYQIEISVQAVLAECSVTIFVHLHVNEIRDARYFLYSSVLQEYDTGNRSSPAAGVISGKVRMGMIFRNLLLHIFHSFMYGTHRMQAGLAIPVESH